MNLNFFAKNNDNGEDPWSLDWGEVAADGFKETTVLHVFNSDLSNEFCAQRAMSLIVNKYRYYKMHLPSEYVQEFTFDIRGQNIPKKKQKLIENDILKAISTFDDKARISIRFFE